MPQGHYPRAVCALLESTVPGVWLGHTGPKITARALCALLRDDLHLEYFWVMTQVPSPLCHCPHSMCTL
jgi:hypothetical protein